MWGAYRRLIRFHERSSGRMKRTFGREALGDVAARDLTPEPNVSTPATRVVMMTIPIAALSRRSMCLPPIVETCQVSGRGRDPRRAIRRVEVAVVAAVVDPAVAKRGWRDRP